MSLLIEYCSPLKSFQHSVSLFLSTIIIEEGRFYSANKKRVEGGCMFPLLWQNRKRIFALSFDSNL